MNDRQKGQRFSLTYLSQGDPINDSDTMRYRLAKLLGKERYQPQKRRRTYASRNSNYVPDPSVIQNLVEEEIGIQFGTFVDGRFHPSWVRFLRKIHQHKVLDTITIAYKGMVEIGRQDDFINQVNRIFREENMAYEVDEEGGVHPIVDRAYAATKQSAVLGMSETRYALSLARVEEVDAALMASPPNFIQAIRSVFGANENLFKLTFDTHRLDARSATEKIGRVLQASYASHPTMQRSSAQILKSFGGWIDAAHHYRHEEGAEEQNQPADELAIVLISQGMSFVRWLVAIDKQHRPK